MKTYAQKFIALFIFSKRWKQFECPSMNGWINKLPYIHALEYHLSIKRKYFKKFLLSCTGGTLCHLQKCLQCIIVEFTPSIILLYPPPIPGIVSMNLMFPFSHMSIQYFHHIHPPTLCPFFLGPQGYPEFFITFLGP
jgi:hypothetical protein